MTSMLDPDVRPSPAKEIVHKGKGCLAVIVAAAVLVFGGYFLYDRASTFLATLGDVPDYPGPGTTPVTVSIPEGASLDEIGSVLVEQNVVKSTKAWNAAVRTEERATSVQAGRYQMRTEMRAVDALQLLINPGTSRVRTQFTIREGLRLSAQVEELVKTTRIPKAEFTKALANPKALGLPAYARNRPEGFLFPDTYELTAEATATSTLRQMVSQFKKVAAGIGLEAGAKRVKLSPYEAVILASLIEREVRNPDDRPKVARVIFNRLAADQPLQMDSTVAYAERLSTTTTTDAQRASTSKYNTYRYPGLPPGPIAAPGRAALEAAINPARGKWRYFVTVDLDSGETRFAETIEEHNRNVVVFQRWCQAHPGRC